MPLIKNLSLNLHVQRKLTLHNKQKFDVEVYNDPIIEFDILKKNEYDVERDCIILP